MSMNKYMHPRNIYKNPPNFKELALAYPEFKNHVKLDLSGKTEFNFKDPEALRVLSSTLLKKDFDLYVEMPNNKLVPTVPLRLNYILWIEDLLTFINRETDIKGIDIGTGASCVYPLLAAKKNGWLMVATETDDASFEYASKNVSNNKLDLVIHLVHVKGDTVLTDVAKEQEFDFCMCNPPFFSSTQELHPFFKSRTQNRPHPKNAFVASVNEVVSKGGEVEFIQRIIKESRILQGKIKIYTTMIGQKSHLPALKKSLREAEVHSFIETEFCQGNTTRWGLAWTFLNYDLRKAPDLAKMCTKPIKTHQPVLYPLTEQKNTPGNVVRVTHSCLKLFKDLQMTIEDVTRQKSHQRFFVTAHANTWSHQRRKRREKLRRMSEEHAESNKNHNNNTPDCKTEDIEDAKSPKKRIFGDLCESAIKKLRLSTDSESSDSSVFFKFLFAVDTTDDKVVLELNTLDTSSNREYLHQILQYLKNNLSLKADDSKE